MSNRVNSVNMQEYPVSYGRKSFEPGHYVVNPPSDFYKFSMYDELQLGRDTFGEFLQKFDPKYAARKQKQRRAKNTIAQVVKFALIVGGACLAYKYRTSIKGTIGSLFNTVKNFVKK